MSTIKADTIVAADGSSPVTLTKQSAAKAWVDANGSAVLSGSFAISSGTDNATGDYSYTFSNAFTDVHFAQQSTSGSSSPTHGAVSNDVGRTTSVMRIETSDNTTNADKKHAITVHGDLA